MDDIIASIGTIGGNAGTILECTSHMCKYTLIGTCAGALGLPILVVTVPFLLGFTVGGAVAGSCATVMMRFHAGHIPIRGFVATMQSIGTMGLAAGFNLFTVRLGCFSGMVLGVYLGYISRPCL
ncbi:MAG: hypothetical protein J3R72DRAFT_455923 [Linnemannia gamsii]|nr:MAG: hypothetical protein J3R72DRAFT_455923 [Linnemannia gamsii]